MMKKIITILGVFLLALSSYAQTPEKISYQAIVRDGSDALVVSAITPIQVSILKTTAGGTAVYIEKHTPTTNTNGLLSIEIGGGAVQSGAFNTIDWSNDSYYIKTEVDVNNDAIYDVTGSSQLLSVPYALQAKSLAGFTSADLAALKDLLPAEIGDFRAGGVVFWVDPTDNTKGLVCAVTDQTSAEWGCFGTDISGAEATDIGTGAANTVAIEASCTTAGTAANLATNLTLNGYSDWFLPSKDELNAMYVNKAAINTTATANGGANFTTDFYWSSSQIDFIDAWAQNFNNGSQNVINKFLTYYVRVVRAF